MKKLKLIITLSVASVTLIIIFLGVWIYNLDQKVATGLAEKKIVKPTEFYTAADAFFKEMKVSQKDFIEILQRRNYREKNDSRRLFEGDYFVGNSDVCKTLIPHFLGLSCVVFSIKQTADPQLKNTTLQAVSFSDKDLVQAVYQGNPAQEVENVYLEPEIFAQYLGESPIAQNYTPLDHIPPQCLNAVIAIEDSRFLEHNGVSLSGILRAVINNVILRRAQQGGSTITQQLVKNSYLSSERTLKRKLNEFFMALILEARSNKDDILETYLNIIYLGQNGTFQIRGYPTAANYYFNKNIEDLNLAECSLLAAVVNSPGLYDPFKNPDRALRRRSLVLNRMCELDLISKENLDEASKEPLPKNGRISISETAPYYIDAIYKQLESLGVEPEETKIFTGLRIKAQRAAQESLNNQLNHLEKENKRINKYFASGDHLEGVVLSADQKTGLIETLVSGRGFRTTQFNRAIESRRQIGSIVKPFVYLTALQEKKYDPLTLIDDIKFTYDYENQSWSPSNFEKKFFGPVPMYFALKHSLNAATAKLGLTVGLNKVADTISQFGIKVPDKPLPSITLGAIELKPLEVLKAYSTIANFGVDKDLSFVHHVIDDKGKILFEYDKKEESHFDPKVVASLVSMMRQTVLSGTAKSIGDSGFNQVSAGKTGTTSDFKDAWYAGFTPHHTAVTWIGYDKKLEHGLTGAAGAVPIWLSFMREREKLYPETLDFSWPQDVHPESKTVTTPDGSETVQLVFAH